MPLSSSDFQIPGGVVEGGPGLIKVGLWDCRGTIWVSASGLEWERVAHDERAGVELVTSGGPGFIALGPRHVVEGHPGVCGYTLGEYLVWVSDDGESWTLVDDSPFDPADEIQDVTDGPAGLVAVGIGWDSGHNVWVSGDGLSWEAHAVTEVVGFVAVEAGGPGYVAVGIDDLSGNAGIWLSGDGVSWERRGPELSDGESIFWEFARGDDGLILANVALSSEVWFSEDGARWQVTLTAEDGVVMALTSYSGGYLAVGGLDDPDRGDPLRAVAWVSADGRSWDQIEYDERLFDDSLMVKATAFRDGAVIFGPADLTNAFGCGPCEVWLWQPHLP